MTSLKQVHESAEGKPGKPGGKNRPSSRPGIWSTSPTPQTSTAARQTCSSMSQQELHPPQGLRPRTHVWASACVSAYMRRGLYCWLVFPRHGVPTQVGAKGPNHHPYTWIPGLGVSWSRPWAWPWLLGQSLHCVWNLPSPLSEAKLENCWIMGLWEKSRCADPQSYDEGSLSSSATTLAVWLSQSLYISGTQFLICKMFVLVIYHSLKNSLKT